MHLGWRNSYSCKAPYNAVLLLCVWNSMLMKSIYHLYAGLTLDGLDLLGQYVDLTSDVQTACMAVLQGLPNPELSKDARVLMWLDSYRGLLDTWRLWHQRYGRLSLALHMSVQPHLTIKIDVSCVVTFSVLFYRQKIDN